MFATSISAVKYYIKLYIKDAQQDARSRIRRNERTATGFTGYLLLPEKHVFPHGPLCIKGYCNLRERLYDTARESIVD
jgi:hypothetical protein